ncbi:MAG: ABC transporter substrate-binding protein, partial [Planctomycetota bacterium]
PKGTGPYSLEEKNIRWGRSLVLTRREDYWAAGDRRNVGRYNFDRIEWTVVRGGRGALGRFGGGAFDVYVARDPRDWSGGGRLDGTSMGWIQKRRVFTEKPAPYTAFVFNMRKPPFNDSRVRLAFAHLFDRAKICKTQFGGVMSLTDSYYPGRPWSDPRAAVRVRFDADRAKSLLNQAGYRHRAQDGWFYRPDGNPLSIVLLYADRDFREVLKTVALDMQSAGIKCTPREVNRQMLLGGIAKNEFALHFIRWETSILPDPGATWSSTRAGGKVGNLPGLQDKRVDDLCTAYYKTEDRKMQLDILRKVDDLVARQHPFALGWYSDHSRILYWDKFGHPSTVLTRLGGPEDILATWWIDGDKEETLKKARHESQPLPVGETDVDPWKRKSKD